MAIGGSLKAALKAGNWARTAMESRRRARALADLNARGGIRALPSRSFPLGPAMSQQVVPSPFPSGRPFAMPVNRPLEGGVRPVQIPDGIVPESARGLPGGMNEGLFSGKIYGRGFLPF